MRAIRVSEFGGPEVLRVVEVEDPEPGRGEIVVRVRAAGVNPVDAYVRTGTYASRPQLPYTPGADGAGVVEQVGAGVDGFRPGDRVYLAGGGSGTYAEKARVPAARAFLLPERLTFEQGAAIGVPWGTAYRALFDKARLAPAEWLLVHGASGGVGTAAVQLARARGVHVIGTAGNDAGRQLARQLGAEAVLDHHDERHLDEARRLTRGHDLDVILELLANRNLGADLGALAVGGRVVVVGSRGNVEINPRDAMSRDATILGMTLFHASDDDLRRIHADLRAGFALGTFAPIVGKSLPLADAPTAQREVLETHAPGKIVLVP